MAEKDFGCFQEGMAWPPPHALMADANAATTAIDSRQKLEEQFMFPTGKTDWQALKHSCYPEPFPPLFHGHTRSNSRPQRTKNPASFTAGGPGMQAIFLAPSQKSSGTGVFLPRRANTDFQFNNKPACSPVLLPSRVIRTLNLNVHELDQQIKPRQDLKKNMKGDNMRNNKGNDCSPEIFLPKEWTY